MAVIDAEFLQRQSDWSVETFGPGTRAGGVIDHIRKELVEIEAAPWDVEEWIDVMILASDGARRAGASPQQIIDTYVGKVEKNMRRVWPDWRQFTEDVAIEHIEAPA